MKAPDSWTNALPEPDATFIARATERQNTLTKPPGSLGRLEQVAILLSGQQRREQPAVNRVYISIFAADHGVCAEGISAFPQEVTAQMIANFSSGGAAISVLAKDLNAELEVINLGTVGDMPAELPGVVNAPIAPGAANLAIEPAMSPEQFALALDAGDQAAARAAESGAELFIAGDMGIGNTTSAAALACVLLNASPDDLVGAGTGLDEKKMAHKAAVVRRALDRHGTSQNPKELLCSLGGFEIAAMTGAFLGAAYRGIPAMVDGFIASVAALLAARQQPALKQWLHFSHRSAERGHQSILSALKASPLLDLGMRLGEASGAAVAVPLLRQACALHNRMASFADAGVSDRSQE